MEGVSTQPFDSTLFKFIIECLLMSLNGVFGLIGNVLCAIILCRLQRRSHSSTNVILIALAIFDVTVVVPKIFKTAIPAFCEFFKDQYSPLHLQHCSAYLLCTTWIQQHRSDRVRLLHLSSDCGKIHCNLLAFKIIDHLYLW